MDQSLIREDIARLQTRVGELIGRFDRTHGFLKAILITLIGGVATVVGAATGGVWHASRVYHAVEDQGRRLEKIDQSAEAQIKLQQSIDRLRQTIDARMPATVK